MPQVDLETHVTACTGGGSDRKIAGETLADEAAGENEDDTPAGDEQEELPPDFPPESFWLSKDAEYDWFDRNAFDRNALFDRKDSTRGNSNSTNLNPNINPNPNSNSNSNSQRFSVNLKSKASIIGLPKTQKTTFDSNRRTCKPANIRLIPKRSESVSKSTGAMAEPSSPKVSCMGRVRSKRGRRRSNSIRRQEKSVDGKKREKSLDKSKTEKPKTGFYSKIMGMFRSKKVQKKPVRSMSRKVMEMEAIEIEPQRRSVSVRLRDIPVNVEAVSEPPGLGGVKRFASGRRSDSWTGDDLSQAITESMDLGRRVSPKGRC